MNKFKYIFIVAFSLGLSFLPGLTLAQGIKDTANLNTVSGKAGVQGNSDLGTIVGTVINVALSLVGIIFLILMVYGGYLWLTARGEESQIDKSKDIIQSAIIGLVIVMSAYAITILVTSRFK